MQYAKSVKLLLNCLNFYTKRLNHILSRKLYFWDLVFVYPGFQTIGRYPSGLINAESRFYKIRNPKGIPHLLRVNDQLYVI